METSKELKIVIVADNPLFAEMLKKTMTLGLEEEDVVINTLGSADVFLKELESNRISSDVIVLDYKLNKRTGEEKDCKTVIDQIKRVSPETAIVVISDEKDMLEAAKTLQYGANEYVSKDKFAFSHITNAVKSCLNPSRS
jgi:DNA-binding NarL/FixJ family response regulator